MADQAERIILEAEDQVTPITDKANASLDSFEKKAESSHGKVIRITDQTRTSVQRLISSLEKQADTYGKSGVEKLIGQRDSLLQRYAKEPQAIDAITASYQKMLAVEEKAAAQGAAAKAAKEAEEALRKQSAAIQALGNDVAAFAQNPLQATSGAISRVTSSVGPLGVALSAGVAALVAVGVAGFEAAKSLGEYGRTIEDVKLRTGLSTKEVGQFGYAARMAGQDVSVFERMMRGLSQAADENSKEGEKARATMEHIGVTMRDATGALKPTSEVLLQIAEGLNKLPEGFERNAATMDLFKRVGIETIPVMAGLVENVRKAKEMGLGASDENLARWAKYHEAVTNAEVMWDRLARKIKEPLAATIMFLFTDQSGRSYSIEELQKRGVNVGPWAPRTDYQNAAAGAAAGFGVYGGHTMDTRAAVTLSDVSRFTSGIEARRQADAQILAYQGRQGLAGQLKDEEEALRNMAEPKVGVTSAKELAAYEAKEKHIEALKNAIEAQKKATHDLADETAHLLELEKRSRELYDKSATVGTGEFGRILGERSALQTSFFSDIRRAGGDPQAMARVRAAYDLQYAANANDMAAAQRHWQEKLDSEAEGAPTLDMEKIYRVNMEKTLAETGGDFFKNNPQLFANTLAPPPGWVSPQRAMRDARDDEQRSLRMFGSQATLGNMPVQDRAAAAEDIRLRAAEKEFDAQMRLADLKGTQEEKDVARAAAEDERDQKYHDARMDREQTLIDHTVKQFEEVKAGASGLFRTLLTKPQAFPHQLLTTARDAAINPFADMVGGAVASIVHPPKLDPMKVSTDTNTLATNQKVGSSNLSGRTT